MTPGDAGSWVPYAGQPAVSGTRLKAMHFEFADGSRTYKRGQLYDTVIDAPCRYENASDGVLRCLPILGHQSVQALIYYNDDQCTEPYALFQAPLLGCGYNATYVNVWSSEPTAACGPQESRVRIYPLTGMIYRSPSRYRIRNGICEPTTGSSPNVIAVSVGPEIAPTEFVEGTRQHVP